MIGELSSIMPGQLSSIMFDLDNAWRILASPHKFNMIQHC